MDGKTPAVALVNPKYAHNVGAAFRACAAFGAPQLWVTGNRCRWEELDRLPREERMRLYNSKVDLLRDDRFLDRFPGAVPVGVEVRESAEILTSFGHPDEAVYVFGPEDGSIPKGYRVLCHRFVIIPSDHCLNLAAAVSCVLMHRRMQRQLAGLEPVRSAAEMMLEERG